MGTIHKPLPERAYSYERNAPVLKILIRRHDNSIESSTNRKPRHTQQFHTACQFQFFAGPPAISLLNGLLRFRNCPTLHTQIREGYCDLDVIHSVKILPNSWLEQSSFHRHYIQGESKRLERFWSWLYSQLWWTVINTSINERVTQQVYDTYLSLLNCRRNARWTETTDSCFTNYSTQNAFCSGVAIIVLFRHRPREKRGVGLRMRTKFEHLLFHSIWENYLCVRFESRNGRLKPLQSFWYTQDPVKL